MWERKSTVDDVWVSMTSLKEFVIRQLVFTLKCKSQFYEVAQKKTNVMRYWSQITNTIHEHGFVSYSILKTAAKYSLNSNKQRIVNKLYGSEL